MLPEQIGYIRPETLLKGKAAEISDAVRSLEKQGAKGLILDLRLCASGTPEEGIAVANLFVDRGLLAYITGQRVQRQEFRADAAKTVTRLPLVVATNGGTADGAEIAAVALLENKRAEVIGGRTFGDAAIRRAVTLEDGGALILSVAKYYSPQSKAIQDTGVVPSVPYIESDPDAQDDDQAPHPLAPRPPVRPEDDGLLKKAVEVLTKGAAAASGQAAAAETARPGPGDIQPGPLGVPRK
jgi:carboxyl-terminal processing protease